VTPAVERAENRPPRSTFKLRLFGAAVIDIVLLASLDLLLLSATAAVSGATTLEVMRQAVPALTIVYLTAAATYFGYLGGIIGTTAGAYIMGIRILSAPGTRLDLVEAFRRTGRCLAREAAILFGVLLPEPEVVKPAAALDPPRHAIKAELPATGGKTRLA
jgi:hypothetical protein